MEDTTRRRNHQASKTTRKASASVAEVGSGGPPEERPSSASDGKSRNFDRRGGRRKLGGDSGGRRRRRDREDPPFLLLFVQVGTALAVICLASYHIYRWVHPTSSWSSSRSMGKKATMYDDDDATGGSGAIADAERSRTEEKLRQEQAQKYDKLLQGGNSEQRDVEETAKPTAPPLPTFELSISSQWDAFGIMDSILSADELVHADTTFWNAAKGLRERFSALYGGENAARMLLDKGTTTFRSNKVGVDDAAAGAGGPPPDVIATACRLYTARVENRPFRMVFGGYSVTAGRGNRFQDSYPFQLQDVLDAVIKLAGIPGLHVRNAAIGGCPSFPYGWCMVNFWGGPDHTDFPSKGTEKPPDAVSWDFSMNESSGGPEGLEAYVRHLLATYASSSHHPPKLIVKDISTANQRKQLLAAYADLLEDTVVLHTDKAVQPFLARQEDFRPIGFQKWRQWGAPNGAPGQALHHPAVQEHKLNGWILAMHLLAALEYMMANLVDEIRVHDVCTSTSSSGINASYFLPPPVSGIILNKTDFAYDRILYGHPVHVAGGAESKFTSAAATQPTNGVDWIMNPVQCRTTFQPILSGDLSEIVVSGTIAEDIDVALPKSRMYYNQGWTFDLSDSEKKAKRQLSVYPDGLGFVDSKEAYYGIYESPKMKLLLPHRKTRIGSENGNSPKIGDLASRWYESVVVCQVNEKIEADGGCNFAADVGFLIGGVNVTGTSANMIETIGSVYLGKPICKQVRIPSEARLTSHNALDDPNKALKEDVVGLLVELYVSNPHIVHIPQACSISHVIWEERDGNIDSMTSTGTVGVAFR